MKKILLISSENTGGGHKSITKALIKQLSLSCPDVQYTVVDGFKFGNWILRFSGRVYDPLAVGLPALWGLIYRLSSPMKGFINAFVAKSIRKSFLKCVEEFHPDLIVSVHALFVGSIIKVLGGAGLNIPVVTLIADLDNVTSLWADGHAKYILCPTGEAKQSMLNKGIANEKLYITGFPVRDEFCSPELPDFSCRRDKTVSILLISGSQGSNKILKITKKLLQFENIHVTVITGHNAGLKKFMEKYLSKYLGNRVTIYGFVTEIKQRMMEADLIILRASPNVLMEAVNLCKPVVVIGALRGQEEKNPQFVLKNKLGVYCRNINKLPGTISQLLKNDGEMLTQIRKNQYRFRKPEAAREISRLLIQAVSETDSLPFVEPSNNVRFRADAEETGTGKSADDFICCKRGTLKCPQKRNSN